MVNFIRKLCDTLGLKEDPDDFLRHDLLCPGCVPSSDLPEILVISGLVVFWILSGIAQRGSRFKISDSKNWMVGRLNMTKT